jgi:dolichol kinase
LKKDTEENLKSSLKTGSNTDKSHYQLKHYRKLLHLLSGIIAVLYYFFPHKDTIFIYVLSILVCSILFFDILRLSNTFINSLVFKYLRHFFIDREKDKINSAAYYFTGVLACIYFFPVEVAVSSILFLSFGDTAASIVGTHLGKHKLVGKKSLEGSLACFVTCFLLAILFLPLKISLIGAFVGTIAELLPWNLDDNITIPVFSGLVMTLFY